MRYCTKLGGGGGLGDSMCLVHSVNNTLSGQLSSVFGLLASFRTLVIHHLTLSSPLHTLLSPFTPKLESHPPPTPQQNQRTCMQGRQKRLTFQSPVTSSTKSDQVAKSLTPKRPLKNRSTMMRMVLNLAALKSS